MNSKANLIIVFKGSGYLGPSAFEFFWISKTCTPSFSASANRPWCKYVMAKLAMLFKVSGCSSPSTFFSRSTACTQSFSASLVHVRPGQVDHAHQSIWMLVAAYLLLQIHNLHAELLCLCLSTLLHVVQGQVDHAFQSIRMLIVENLVLEIKKLCAELLCLGPSI